MSALVGLGDVAARAGTSERALDVAALELPQRFGDRNAVLTELERILSGPALMGVDLVLLPELILTGYVSPHGDFDLRRFAEPAWGDSARRLGELARAHRIALAGPLVEESEGKFYNAFLVLDDEGHRIAHYRKRHPWFPETWATPGVFEPPVVEIAGVKLTVAICFDIHFISDDAGPVLDAADVLLFPSAWVEPPQEGDLRAALLPPLARRHRIAVVNANWGWSRPRVSGQGGSRILDPRGRLLAAAPAGRGPAVVRALLRFEGP